MELIILGNIHNPSKEIEIFPENKELGFDITITDDNDNIKICHNCTEFHYLFDGYDKFWGDANSLACESDIHGTGYAPWDIFNKFKKIVVKNATELHNEF